MVGTVAAAAPRAVTLGERSIWTLFYVCSSPFLGGPSADLFNVLKSLLQRGCLVVPVRWRAAIFPSNLVLGVHSFTAAMKSRPCNLSVSGDRGLPCFYFKTLKLFG